MNVFGIAGYSGSGKTTLLEKLLPLIVARGLRVSVIKHTHHHFDIDRPGKDSFRHRQAGASEVLLASASRWVLMNELRGAPEPSLAECVAHFAPCDLVLVEGFKGEEIPTLEVYRPANGKPPLWPDHRQIVAVACDQKLPSSPPCDLAAFDLNDAPAIVRFVLDAVQLP
ncbi:MAG: molybdopterin-guanine dinucleotide biosynthesis protein B [Rhodobacteraceae bacterium]|uniref:molybdopterin-guanine dinucleotide biosynthesis protein B n=1 Tax=Accumulibacter sp. TaxID=2053492 RepID=UPI0019FF0504|nr:molybdopterin-guanine dinucleotide biosynthesis protein B [Accumulibacter sp.]MBE2257343.1 molybdopterin-guanine dinucleotide biosynthesis protein B [Paracoccaceae bacterium]MCB1940867.1 molybdopterin-guanine dinucleotide biosynthesis protein B [Accumulibacter sp.]